MKTCDDCGCAAADSALDCPDCGATLAAAPSTAGDDVSAVTRQPRKSLAHHVATVSWVCGCVAIALVVVGYGAATVVAALAALAAIALAVIGIGCGIAALVETRRHGARGILAPALIGLIIDGIVIVFLLSGLFKAMKARGQ